MDNAPIIPEIAGSSGDVAVRRWTEADAQELNETVERSRGHLRPWMPWAAEPALTLTERQQKIADWAAEWLEGGDCVYGIFVAGEVAGGGGLHRRLGPDGLEIGYWLSPAFTGRGVMTIAAALMTATAFSMPEIALLEIHHDRANIRSEGIPRRLGYRLVEQVPRAPQAPGETGNECRWRITRGEWEAGGVSDGLTQMAGCRGGSPQRPLS